MTTLKKIHNPFVHQKGSDYNCFGCSPGNHMGLKLEFFADNDHVVAYWCPNRGFEGYTNVVHGGIQATLLDEIASWYIYAMLDTVGVTRKLDVSYHKPFYVSTGKARIEASLIQQTKSIALIKAKIVNANGVICSSARVEYYLFPPEIARVKYNYPGIEAFYE